MQKILILVAATAEEGLTAEGEKLLRDFQTSYQRRVAAAQVAPDYVRDIVTSFQREGGRVIICLAPPQDRLASHVSSLVSLPVLHVAAQAGMVPLDQLPGPIPVATLGQGAGGFAQAALFALQVLALHDPQLSQNLQRHRHSLAARMIAADQNNQVIFDV